MLFAHPRPVLPAILVAALLAPLPGPAAEVVSVSPLTADILLVHLDDGRVEPHRRGEPRGADKVFVEPLDVALADSAATFSLRSADDPAYAEPLAPVSVARKTKGTEFAWKVEAWRDGRAHNTSPDHAAEHWLYLRLPAPLQPGKTYRLGTGKLASNGAAWTFVADPARSRSEAVHVNTLGHVPSAPAKYGYLYHWMGAGGPLDLAALEGGPFHLLRASDREVVFTGSIRFRAPRTLRETQHVSDSPPHGNFLGADVWECDFSAFSTPGEYVLSAPGVGCSWPFRMADDVYREPYYHVARALHHNRSGIELKEPHTRFARPAPHHPGLTPGFAGRLFYTAVRFTEWGSEGGKAAALKAGAKGPLDAWGWYQDAGDWDGYYSHLRVAEELLFSYELAPAGHRDGDLDIPESGNGVPDILDEAAWLPRYCHRLRHELLAKGYGSGGLGLRVAGDAFGGDEKVLPGGKKVGQGSWEDVNRDWAVSGEDPWSTYRYAGAAAHLAHALRLAGVARDPEGVDWAREAREAYAWAEANTRPGDEQKRPPLAQPRAYAAAALFRLTGERGYEARFLADTVHVTETTYLLNEARYAPFLYALTAPGHGAAAAPDPAAHARITAAVLHTSDESMLRTAERRALRWGGVFSMPMLIGQQTTPWVLEGVVGHQLHLRAGDTDKALRTLAALHTTCDYFLGTNSLNQTWITGVGPRFPTQIFHMDAWYRDTPGYQPGLIPYSPWRKEKDLGSGPWDQAWPHQTLHPSIDEWPGNERWFSNRCSPMGSEFTVHQQSGPAAAIFGYLHALSREP
jgi:hypothetical protein